MSSFGRPTTPVLTRLRLAVHAAAAAAALCLAVGSAAAQPDEGRYRFTRYGEDAGLPSELVSEAVQDSAGFVWVATRDGVARLDGVRSRVWRHRPGSETGLPSSIIGAVHVDGEGTVWVGTPGGLAWFDEARGRFVRFAEDALREVGGINVSQVTSDSGGLWVSSERRIYRVRRDGSAARVPGDGGLILRLPERDEVWSQQGVCRLRDRPVRCQPFFNGGPESLLTVWGAGGRALGSTNSGVLWELAPRLRRLGAWPGFQLPEVTMAIHTPPLLWAASVDGLFVYDTERGQTRRVSGYGGAPEQDIRAVTTDRQGGVWLSTALGLYRWSRPDPAFRAVSARDGLPDPRVNGIATLAGTTLVGTNGGLFRRLAGEGARGPGGERWGAFFAGDKAYVNGVWQVTPASGGGVWVGGKAFGLRRLWPVEGRWEPVSGPSRLLGLGRVSNSALPVRAVTEADGWLWVGSTYGLAVRDRSGAWSGFLAGEGEGDGLPTLATNVVHVGEGGRVWIGTDRGLTEFTPATGAPPRGAGANGRFRQVAPTSLGRPVVWDVAESPDDPGALWIATVGTGACRLDVRADRVRCFTAADGMPSNAVHRIEAGAGAVWLGTDRGLARLDLGPEVTGPAASGAGPPASGVPSGAAAEVSAARGPRITTYTRADGLHGDVIDLMSSHADAEGRLYFGGPGGYTVFDPAAVEDRTAPPPPRFATLTVAGVLRPRVSAGDTLRLEPDGRRFAATFATLDFTAPARNRYRYRLLPLETEWTEADAGTAEARYAALPPGAYTLEVDGTGYASGFSGTPARLYVSVVPRWWERGAVRALGFLLALGAVGALGWAGVQRSERQRREAAEVAHQLAAAREAERLRLARDLHDGAMQHLYRTGHDLDRLAAHTDPEAVAGVRAGLDEAAGELRAVLTDIRPPHLGTLGVGAALEAAARPFARTYPDLALELDAQATGRRWPAAVQTAAYRIAQEALSNAGRHAEASRVAVSLREEDRHAVVEVRDDGRGFDAETPDLDLVRSAHFGLAGLRERAVALGGEVRITSALGEGTTVLARLPLGSAAPSA